MLFPASSLLFIGVVLAHDEAQHKDVSQKFKQRASAFHQVPAELDGSTLGKTLGQVTRVQAFHRARVAPRQQSAEGGLGVAFRQFQEDREAELSAPSAAKDMADLAKSIKHLRRPSSQEHRSSEKIEGGVGPLWYHLQGRKERKWSPDRRPAAQRGIRVGLWPISQLSWGGGMSSARYALMAKHRDSFSLSSQTINNPVELAELIFGKYGYYYDVAMMRNGNDITLNIYSRHLGMRTFPYTEQQYLDKLASIICLLSDLDQAWYVKDFLLSPPEPRNDLPSTPRPDTAISVHLKSSPTWDGAHSQEIYNTWLMLRGQWKSLHFP
jgi:hypothetical protein